MGLTSSDCECWGDHNGMMENPNCILHGANREEDRRQMTELTFQTFSEVNMQRHLDWPRNGNGKKPPSHEWSLSDWGVAVAEEVGEVCGAIKRYNRITAGHIVLGKDNEPITHEQALLMLKKEIGDATTYLDLLAQAPEVESDLGECTQLAFNGVSERQGLPHKV